MLYSFFQSRLFTEQCPCPNWRLLAAPARAKHGESQLPALSYLTSPLHYLSIHICQSLNQYKVTSVIAKRQKILLVIFRILTPRIVLHRPSLKNASYPPLPFHKQKGAVLKAKNPPTLTCRPLLTSCSAVSWKLHNLFTRTYFHPWKNS